MSEKEPTRISAEDVANALRPDQPKMDEVLSEIRAALAQLDEVEIWWVDASNHLWADPEQEHPALRAKLERVLVIPAPEVG